MTTHNHLLDAAMTRTAEAYRRTIAEAERVGDAWAQAWRDAIEAPSIPPPGALGREALAQLRRGAAYLSAMAETETMTALAEDAAMLCQRVARAIDPKPPVYPPEPGAVSEAIDRHQLAAELMDAGFGRSAGRYSTEFQREISLRMADRAIELLRDDAPCAT